MNLAHCQGYLNAVFLLLYLGDLFRASGLVCVTLVIFFVGQFVRFLWPVLRPRG